jgi:hypothetical protein
MLASERDGSTSPRFRGLVEHVRHRSRDELSTGAADYDFDHPPDNPTTYLPIRENLVKAMTAWTGGAHGTR